MRTTVYAGMSGWRRMVVLLTAMAVSLVGLLAVQGQVSAHDHRIPKTVLMRGREELQTDRKVEEFAWAYPSRNGNVCFVDEGTFPFGFPTDVSSVAAGSKLKVRIYKNQKPDTFSVTAYSRLKGNGEPVDATGRPLGTSLEAVVRDGR